MLAEPKLRAFVKNTRHFCDIVGARVVRSRKFVWTSKSLSILVTCKINSFTDFVKEYERDGSQRLSLAGNLNGL